MKNKPKGSAMLRCDIQDELHTVTALLRAISLLVSQGDHKLYTHDPLPALFIVLDEKLALIGEGLEGLS